MRRLAGIAALVVAVTLVMAGALWIYVKQQYEAPGPLAEELPGAKAYSPACSARA